MTDKPIIHASLVDARNVASSKEIKLDVRIPAEMAAKFLEVFGWPTQVSPVSVAIVPLMDGAGAEEEPEEKPVSEDAFKRIDAEPRHHFTDMPRMKQAGIRCREPAFWAFLNTRFDGYENLPVETVVGPDSAAEVVRWWCMVESRRDLDKPEGAAARLWDDLEAKYYAEQHGMH